MTSNLSEAFQKVAELSGEEQDVLARLMMEQIALCARERETAAAAAREGVVPGPATAGPGGVQVLVVDDEDLLLDYTRKCLAQAGYKVLVANGGEAAIQVLEGLAEPVALLLVDCNMPGMSGPELIEVVAMRWPTVKFVVTSGFLTDANYARVEPYGAGILAKPYDPNDITRAVSEKLAE